MSQATTEESIPTIAERMRFEQKSAEQKAAEARSEQQAEIMAFTPPKCLEGTTVCWYEGGDPNRMPLLGDAANPRGKCVDVYLKFGGMLKPGCRHISDPQLVSNANIREFGAWDFAPAFVQEQHERKKMLEILEECHQMAKDALELAKKTAAKGASK